MHNLILVAPISQFWRKEQQRERERERKCVIYRKSRLRFSEYSLVLRFRGRIYTLPRSYARSLYHAAPQGLTANRRSHWTSQTAAFERSENSHRRLDVSRLFSKKKIYECDFSRKTI